MESAERPVKAISFLCKNMHERMDAFVAVNEDSRRKYHLQRYRFAADHLNSAGIRGIVLDAACGTGYGSKILLETCGAYIGIDVSSEASEYARKFYGGASRLSLYRLAPLCLALRRLLGLEPKK